MYPVYLIHSKFEKLPDKLILFCFAFSISVFSNCSPYNSFTLIAELNRNNDHMYIGAKAIRILH